MYEKNLFNPSRQQFAPPREHYFDRIYRGISIRHFPSFASNSPEQVTILFCHGNNGNLTHRNYLIPALKRFGCNLVLFDYPGYGSSPGKPTPENVRESGEIVYEWMVKEQNIDPKTIVVWGESLGGSPATRLASRHPEIRALVLLSTFSSLDDIFLHSHDLFSRIIVTGCRYFFDTLPNKTDMANVKSRVVIIHSYEDTVIPYSNARILHDAVPHENKHLIPIRGDHIEPQLSPRVQMEIFRLLLQEPMIDAMGLFEIRQEVDQLQEELYRDPDFYLPRYRARRQRQEQKQKQTTLN